MSSLCNEMDKLKENNQKIKKSLQLWKYVQVCMCTRRINMISWSKVENNASYIYMVFLI